jgi:glutathione S-transferase
MNLYQLPFSHHAAKVRIALLEKGIAHELLPIPGGSTRSPEFLAMNPMGQVPFLVDGAVSLAESEVIVEYLEDVAPEPAMLPRSPAARARSRWLTRFHDLYFGKQLSALFFALAAGKKGDPAMTQELDELYRLLGILEGAIEPSPWFFGETFGLADAAYALSVQYLLDLTKAYERPVQRGDAPKLLGWFDEAKKRTSVARVLADCQAALAAG